MSMVTTTHKKSEDEKNKDELVITPGGPRPKSSIRQLGPDEAVYRREDGTYSVSKRQHSEARGESEQQET
jgi:hypothetical protein